MSLTNIDDLKTLDDYERKARKTLIPSHLEYICGGVGDNVSLKLNRTIFDSLLLVPRVLRNVAERSLETNIFGV
jgi:isopentenyl diphosphate isomerase/L-lactate dehydrogenase-like FMN-dependent dehydrogenase